MWSTWPSHIDSRSLVKVKGFILEYGVCFISPEPGGQFYMKLHLNVPLSEKLCRIFELSMKTQGHTSRSCALHFNLCSISPDPLVHLPKCSSQLMCRTCKPNVKVTFQGHVIYPPCCVHSISHKTFERFSLNFTQMFFLVMGCAEPMTQLCRLKVKVTLQCHGIYP